MPSDRDPWAGPHPHPERFGERVLVCLEGHLVSDAPAPGSAAVERLCPQCAVPVIAECPGCREPILGVPGSAYRLPGLGGVEPGARPLLPPRYCHCCGRPFPWTERVVSAVRTAIRELRMLDAFERDQLRRSLDHIIHETPQTGAALVRINAALTRIGGETADRLRELLMSVATESVRTQLEIRRSGRPQ